MNIEIGTNLQEEIIDYIKIFKPNKIFLLTDNTIYNLYEKYIKNILEKFDYNILTINSGEEYKDIDTILSIYDELIENNFSRKDLFIGFGGGVIGDIGGFASSTYMRGINYIQIPTTLLSQVDSSVGGKTGFDYKGYKNIIGSFHFPIKTFIDIDFINTLDNRNIISGMGEILKYGLIDDIDFFNFTIKNNEKVFEKNIELLNKIVKKSIETKIKFVKDDEKDFGKRRELNFGHTIGHSIESLYNFNKYNHGEAVILGIQYESYIGYLMNEISIDYFYDIKNSLSKYIEIIKFTDEEIEKLLLNMKKDKKNEKNNISMIVPVEKGKVKYFDNINEEYIKIALKGEWIEDKRS